VWVAGICICGAGACTAMLVGAGQVELAMGRVQVVLDAGAGQVRVEKFFVQK